VKGKEIINLEAIIKADESIFTEFDNDLMSNWTYSKGAV